MERRPALIPMRLMAVGDAAAVDADFSELMMNRKKGGMSAE